MYPTLMKAVLPFTIGVFEKRLVMVYVKHRLLCGRERTTLQL